MLQLIFWIYTCTVFFFSIIQSMLTFINVYIYVSINTWINLTFSFQCYDLNHMYNEVVMSQTYATLNFFCVLPNPLTFSVQWNNRYFNVSSVNLKENKRNLEILRTSWEYVPYKIVGLSSCRSRNNSDHVHFLLILPHTRKLRFPVWTIQLNKGTASVQKRYLVHACTKYSQCLFVYCPFREFPLMTSWWF